MAALLFLFTMAVPGDAAVLPQPAQYSLHHVTYYSAFFFVLGGALPPISAPSCSPC
jgi:hypothetical protein